MDRFLNIIHRAGQYYNIPYLRSFKKYKPTLEEERKIHFSSTIALNIHEDYQKEDSGDLNERTFKIPMSDTFKIVHGMVEKALSQVIPLSPASLHLPVKRVICSRLTRQLSHSVVLVV